MLNSTKGKLDLPEAFNILRDHGGDEYRPDSHLLISTICMHAANGLSRNSNTTGSLVAHLKKETHTFWATGTAAPCTGIFKPVRFGNEVLPDLGPPPGEKFDSAALWWQHEALHRHILRDYPSRISKFRAERDRLEDSFLKKAEILDPAGFFELSGEAFQDSRELTEHWIRKYQDAPVERGPGIVYRQYWKKQNRASGMILKSRRQACA